MEEGFSMFKMRESCKYLDVEGKDSVLKEC